MESDSRLPRRTVLQGVCAVAVLMASGCSALEEPKNVQESDFFGSWHSNGGGQNTTTMDFRGDGTFEWSGVPRGVSDVWATSGKLDWDNRTSYEGKWTIEPDLLFPDKSVIELDPDVPQDSRSFGLFIEGNGSGRTLYYSLGDPDLADRLTFHR